MARVRRSQCAEDDESDYVVNNAPLQPRLNIPSSRQTRTSPRKKATSSGGHAYLPASEEETSSIQDLVPKISRDSVKRRKQIRLAPIKCLSDRDAMGGATDTKMPVFRSLTLMDEPSPQRRIRQRVQTGRVKPGSLLRATDDGEEVTEAEIDESIWCGTDTSEVDCSEDDLPSPRKFLPPGNSKAAEPDVFSALAQVFDGLTILDETKTIQMNTIPSSTTSIVLNSRPSSSSDKENRGAVLRFSPPRLYSPSKKRQDRDTEVTPPPSPSKGKLQSPSKQRSRVPTPPHRVSLGAFWDPETVNDWNDQYSPLKEWQSPKKLNPSRDDRSASPSCSPRKLSPTKRTKAEIEARKDWEVRKHDLAQSFLAELDQVTTSGQISTLAAVTGGVKIFWSKTLKQTAGRANWRNEKTRTKHPDGSTTVTNKHHASIELAEKVIDDEERLLNVVAHEFCHLCNFMISGVKDQPHGKQFKDWGRKVSMAFRTRGIEVTTKHTYTIEYKYLWRCVGEFCGAEFKRHSKSIDPAKQRCGSCKSILEQIRPVPRKETAGTSKVNGYASFVKSHYALVKKEMQGASQKEVMEAVARRYRAEKTMVADEKQVAVSSLASKLELDDVARKLEFALLNDG